MSCSMDDCSSVGAWHPVLELRSRKNGPITRATMMQLLFCDEHKAAKGLTDFLSNEGFVKIAKFLRENGKENPIQRNTTLTWSHAAPEEIAETVVQVLIEPSPDDDLPF